ncbi:hypothetical protein Spiaf_2676 [Spirochaeta africana DSM 8902]|uniref:BFN domain-containing protein n=2 Tax=Spirochaeta TaxID=146 RepID=H9UMF9_SPIAZ|nr:hypothetical protein Spiaf_2676 [Spirochaeta africana DSM 8902]
MILEHAQAQPLFVLGVEGHSRRILLPMEITKANALIAACLQQDGPEVSSLYGVIGALLDLHATEPADVCLDDVQGSLAACLEYHAEDGPHLLTLDPGDGVALSIAGQIPLLVTEAGLRGFGSVPGSFGGEVSGDAAAGGSATGGPVAATANVIPFPALSSWHSAGQAR